MLHIAALTLLLGIIKEHDCSPDLAGNGKIKQIVFAFWEMNLVLNVSSLFLPHDSL